MSGVKRNIMLQMKDIYDLNQLARFIVDNKFGEINPYIIRGTVIRDIHKTLEFLVDVVMFNSNDIYKYLSNRQTYNPNAIYYQPGIGAFFSGIMITIENQGSPIHPFQFIETEYIPSELIKYENLYYTTNIKLPNICINLYYFLQSYNFKKYKFLKDELVECGIILDIVNIIEEYFVYAYDHNKL